MGWKAPPGEGDGPGSGATPPCPHPVSPPGYGRVLRLLVAGAVASLIMFGVVYAEVWSLGAAARHPVPWLTLLIGLLITFVAAHELLTTLDQAVRHEDVARRRGQKLDVHRERTQEVLARIQDAVVVTDPQGHVLEWNQAAVRMIGRSAPDARGRHCTEALGIRSVDRPLDCAAGCALLRQSDPARDLVGVEVLRDRETGRPQPLLANVGTVRDERGEVVEIVHSLRDITRLREADEAKSMFLATTSHELRTPLTVIQGFVETLLHRDLDPETRITSLETVLARVVELGRMVDELLQSSRIERGRLDLHPEPVDAVPLVRRHVQELRATTGRSVRLAVPAEAVVVWADSGALGTVLDHLLTNAIKYSPGGGALEVRLAVHGDRVAVVVRDHGIGMDATAVTRCFERFWQADQTDGRRFGGTGIGLYLVRSLVEGMHGEVSARSTPGAGSVLTVSLRTRPPTPEDAKPGRTTTGGGGSRVADVLRHAGVRSGR